MIDPGGAASMRYITDLMVLEGKNAEAPSGWTKIDKDLNAGAGGAYLYFAYEEGDDLDRALRKITFLDRNEPVPHGYTRIDVDLNKGAHGEYIYAAFTRERRVSPVQFEDLTPIVALDVVISGVEYSDILDDGQWVMLSQDLNQGAKGKYIYLRFKNLTNHSGSPLPPPHVGP
jgi:hypothetical protein